MDGEYDFILDTVMEHWSFDSQVLALMDTLELSSKEETDSKLMLKDINLMVNYIWRGCTVNVFGSLLTGLAFKNSDMDCFIQLPSYCFDSPETCWKQVYHVVSASTSFKYESCIPWASVPVITLIHSKTGRKCDLTFNGRIALETSKLVKYLLKLDKRAHKLAVLIKYWAKVQNLTGKNLLSNHAITLLVIFFLQHKKILPSVALLQENVVTNTTEGWNTAFKPLPYRSSNYEDLYTLLRGFFEYYDSFRFETHVICPYLGRPVQVRQFSSTDSLPFEFGLYKERVKQGKCKSFVVQKLCIQDLFEHNRNTAVCIPNALFRRLECCFSTALFTFHWFPHYKLLKELLIKQKEAYSVPEFRVPEYEVPRKGRSWTFYFFSLVGVFIVYSIFTNNK